MTLERKGGRMDMQNNRGMMTSETDEWSTPQDLFDEFDRVYGFELDVSATPENTKCGRFYTKDDDGLRQEWHSSSRVAWMNPPYGRTIGAWVEKAYRESQEGMTIVCLLPARTDTAWFHEWVAGKAELTFLRGRLKFGGHQSNAPFPSLVAVYRPKAKVPGWTL